MVDKAVVSRRQQGYGTIVFTKYKKGNEVTATQEEEWVMPFNGIIVDVICHVATAQGPLGSTSIIDVNINGTTIYTTQANRPTLADGDTGYYTEAGEPEITVLRVGDILSYDVDQIGSGTAATRFKITIVVQST